jgi:hypothetical protein
LIYIDNQMRFPHPRRTFIIVLMIPCFSCKKIVVDQPNIALLSFYLFFNLQVHVDSCLVVSNLKEPTFSCSKKFRWVFEFWDKLIREKLWTDLVHAICCICELSKKTSTIKPALRGQQQDEPHYFLYNQAWSCDNFY